MVWALLCLLQCGLRAQNVLDGAYIKEMPTHIEYSNQEVSSPFKNTIFCIRNLLIDTTFNNSDSKLNYYKSKFLNNPLKHNDCVYFRPAENYIFSFTPEKKKETFFYLNRNIQLDMKGEYLGSENNGAIYKYRKQNGMWGNSLNEIILPNSLRFYLDTSDIKINPGQPEMILDSNFKVATDKYLRPFYFGKFAVTNTEYREFVKWVLDSIVRMKLATDGLAKYAFKNKAKQLNWDIPINWNSDAVKECIADIYLPSNERFYRNKEIDPRLLQYSYFKKLGVEEIPSVINVYPDTLSWINDFPNGWNEEMTNMYFWHKFYDDYPVVGITYWQAMAYLYWKTEREQKKLNAKGIKMKVEYDLPTEIEWEIASTSEASDKSPSIYDKNYYFLADDSWMTNLKLTPKDDVNTVDSIDHKKGIRYETMHNDLLSDQLKGNSKFKQHYDVDGYYHPTTSDIKKSKKEGEKRINPLILSNMDANDICFQGGNVSEWLKESYQENWLPIFTMRQRLLKTFKDENVKLLSELETFYDKNNDKDGRLVRGANWYDERFSNKLGKNTEGANAKVFVSPDKDYCTLGFRYVIHYYPE